ncbi:LLM class flavin-dependent oxidoreductase [Pseudonocardia sp. GCM10023141]|uniref:LLM class flavin-dependent oxidoreductase n=1 Tax=Pseudonocardia sp. GCM10023141 TaxID=3252653 RepID=UPI00361E28B4
MDFGIINEFQVPRPWGPRSEYDAFWNALEQAKLADRLGYSHIWAVEHHFLAEFSHSSAPEVWLAAVAQHTENIRIGHGVALLPNGFNHPVRVAERVALLDILSNGRMELGTGRSVTTEELGGFGIDPGDSKPMWREAVELIPQLWTAQEPMTFEGTYTTLTDRLVLPKPLQRPHPPMWAACTSPDSWSQAGELGLGVLGFSIGSGPDALARRIAVHRTALDTAESAGRVVNRNVAVFMMTFCAPTDAEARVIAEDAFTTYIDQTMQYFLQWGRGGELPPGYEWYAEAARSTEKIADHRKFDHLLENGTILCGSPDTIAPVVQRYMDAGATQVILGTQLGRIAHEDVLASLRLFGAEVLPQFTGTPAVARTGT